MPANPLTTESATEWAREIIDRSARVMPVGVGMRLMEGLTDALLAVQRETAAACAGILLTHADMFGPFKYGPEMANLLRALALKMSAFEEKRS